jgi:predicted amidophosphoribosyltransferase
MRFMECFHCGTAVLIGEHYLTPEGFHCCSDCFDERYAICDGCGETFEHDDLTDGRCSSCVPTELEDTNESQ